MLRGLRVGEGPGVEEGDPAAQYGAVVAVPGTQPPAGPGAVAVHLDESGEAGGVPVGADLSHGQAQVPGGPFGARVGEGGLAVGGRAVAARAERGVGPAGDAGRGGQTGASHSGQLRGRRCALRRAGRGAARAPLVHSCGGGGQGSRADESKPGVARDTGRHGCSLPVDGPKTQTECHRGRRDWPTHGVRRAPRGRELASGTALNGMVPTARLHSGPAPREGHMSGVRKRRSASS